MNTEKNDYAPMCTDCGERDCSQPDECKEASLTPIGWMFHTGKGFAVRCHGCAGKNDPHCPSPIPVYHANIFPYRQSCFDCGTQLVIPQTDAWCELFTGR